MRTESYENTGSVGLLDSSLCCSGDHFPLEARHHLAPWIDQNFTADLDLGNPQHEEHAQRLVMELVAQLESKERPSLAATVLITLLGRKFSE